MSAEEIARWDDISRRMVVPFHDDGIISQFEGNEKLRELNWENYRTRYGNIQRLDLILDAENDKDEIFEKVKNAAYEIINRKGYTDFAIALAVVRIVTSILGDENSVLTVSTLINNYYDISNVCLSIPTVLNMNGISKHIDIDLDEVENHKLRASAEALKEIIGQLKI